ncbi:unnamed protein product, partial [Meganyctiphanes norvegica]
MVCREPGAPLLQGFHHPSEACSRMCMECSAIMGYLEAYFYIFLSGIGSSNTLIGLTVTIGVPFEIMIQISATAIVGKIGHVNSLACGVFLLFIRALGKF